MLDAEHIVSHWTFLIDMLAWSDGKPAPRERVYKRSLAEMEKLREVTGDMGVRIKPYNTGLLRAEKISRGAPHPTDGVIAIWPGTNTSRKMKESIELLVGCGGSLSTSDEDLVFQSAEIPAGAIEGDIVNMRI